jgi:hypothetical protein
MKVQLHVCYTIAEEDFIKFRGLLFRRDNLLKLGTTTSPYLHVQTVLTQAPYITSVGTQKIHTVQSVTKHYQPHSKDVSDIGIWFTYLITFMGKVIPVKVKVQVKLSL